MDEPAASSSDEVFRKHTLTLIAHFIHCIHWLRKVLIFMELSLRAFASSYRVLFTPNEMNWTENSVESA